MTPEQFNFLTLGMGALGLLFAGATTTVVVLNFAPKRSESATARTKMVAKAAKASADEASHHSILTSRAISATNDTVTGLALTAQINAAKIEGMSDTIHLLEVNTNSIKDALVAVTREAGGGGGRKTRDRAR